MKQGLNLQGRWQLELKKHGRGLWLRKGTNLVTSAGLLLAARRLGGIAADPISHAAIGAGTTVPALSQTALQGTEHERVETTESADGNELTCSCSFGSGIAGSQTCAEIGMFNAASTGTMFSRFIFTPFDMDNTMTLELTWVLALE